VSAGCLPVYTSRTGRRAIPRSTDWNEGSSHPRRLGNLHNAPLSRFADTKPSLAPAIIVPRFIGSVPSSTPTENPDLLRRAVLGDRDCVLRRQAATSPPRQKGYFLMTKVWVCPALELEVTVTSPPSFIVS